MIRKLEVLPIDDFAIEGKLVAGVIGRDVLESMRIEMSPANRVVEVVANFVPHAESLPDLKESTNGTRVIREIPMDNSHGGPLVFLKADGHVRVMRVDLGSGSTRISFRKDKWEATGLPKSRLAVVEWLHTPAELGDARWTSEELEVADAVVDDFDLFGAVFHDVPILAMEGAGELGVLGCDFLRRFEHASLDFRRRTLTLEREEPAQAAALSARRAYTGGMRTLLCVMTGALLCVSAGCEESSPSGSAVDTVNGLTGDVEIVSSNASVTITADSSANRVDLAAIESDPAFNASAAVAVTQAGLDAWNAAAGWGDHSLAGYLVTESDPDFASSAAAGILDADLVNWDAAFGWGNHAAAGYLTAESNASLTCGAPCVSIGELDFDPATQAELVDVASQMPTSVDGFAGGTITSAVSVAGTLAATTMEQNGNVVCDNSGNCGVTGAAGGSLSGTYPDPSIANGAVGPAQHGTIPAAHIARFSGLPVDLAVGSNLISWDAAIFNRGNMWNGGAPTQILVATSGIYHVEFVAKCTNFNLGDATYNVVVRQNGALEPVSSINTVPSSAIQSIHASGDVLLTASSTLDFLINVAGNPCSLSRADAYVRWVAP